MPYKIANGISTLSLPGQETARRKRQREEGIGILGAVLKPFRPRHSMKTVLDLSVEKQKGITTDAAEAALSFLSPAAMIRDALSRAVTGRATKRVGLGSRWRKAVAATVGAGEGIGDEVRASGQQQSGAGGGESAIDGSMMSALSGAPPHNGFALSPTKVDLRRRGEPTVAFKEIRRRVAASGRSIVSVRGGGSLNTQLDVHDPIHRLQHDVHHIGDHVDALSGVRREEEEEEEEGKSWLARQGPPSSPSTVTCRRKNP
jgi:hypothetical protein